VMSVWYLLVAGQGGHHASRLRHPPCIAAAAPHKRHLVSISDQLQFCLCSPRDVASTVVGNFCVASCDHHSDRLVLPLHHNLPNLWAIYGNGAEGPFALLHIRTFSLQEDA
jgi:hypothetical protein